jgi:hypothetical protein
MSGSQELYKSMLTYFTDGIDFETCKKMV